MKLIPLLLPFVLLPYLVSGQLKPITTTTFPEQDCHILTNNKLGRNPWPNQLIDKPASISDNAKKNKTTTPSVSAV
jgi:hypothetical protein